MAAGVAAVVAGGLVAARATGGDSDERAAGVEMSAGVHVPMISYPDLMVYSNDVHLAPGETAEYTAASTLMQGGPAVPLNPDSTALVVDWTQLGDAALPRCDR